MCNGKCIKKPALYICKDCKAEISVIIPTTCGFCGSCNLKLFIKPINNCKCNKDILEKLGL